MYLESKEMHDVIAAARDLHRFLGYGSPTAHLVFMGLEEGGSEAQFPKDSTRSKFEDLDDYMTRSGYPLQASRTPT